MDGSQFDRLTRDLGGGGSRRALLKGLLGIGGMAAGATIRTPAIEAARRTTPTPTPVTCPGNQIWNGSACVCPSGSTACGPDCCPNGQAKCCDSACCYGECYGEELCCPTGSTICQNSVCCAPGEVCAGNGSCCQPQACSTGIPDGYLGCGQSDDGCGGERVCACPDGWLCIAGDSGTFCGNLTTTCVPGLTAATYGQIGLCAQGSGFCANTVAGNETECLSLTQALCNDCASDADCSAISGAVCVEAYVGVCPTGVTTMCAQVL